MIELLKIRPDQGTWLQDFESSLESSTLSWGILGGCPLKDWKTWKLAAMI